MRFHHVQLSMPRASEARARRFYVDGLGLTEIAKPAALAVRGAAGSEVSLLPSLRSRSTLGSRDPFIPARRAHPGLLVDGIATLEALGNRLAASGYGWTGPNAGHLMASNASTATTTSGTGSRSSRPRRVATNS